MEMAVSLLYGYVRVMLTSLDFGEHRFFPVPWVPRYLGTQVPR